MTPRDVDLLSSEEYHALTRYAEKDIRDQNRQARRKR